MIDNEVTRANGKWEQTAFWPFTEVVVAIPLNENPALRNSALLQSCLYEIKVAYPRVISLHATIEPTTEFGDVLQIIVRGSI